MRNATSQQKRGIRRMPKGYQDFFSDLTRKKPRSKSYFSHVPTVADAMASAGAKLSDVIAPLNAERVRIEAKHYGGRLPSMEEAQQTELNAQAHLDAVQLRAERECGRLGHPTRATAQALIEAANDHEVAIHILSVVALRDAR